ncbi:MAG: hypothetical protein PHQ27_06170 [Victivallales bacterium]|nr:hypothetical protein [Victivallales bacterium]
MKQLGKNIILLLLIGGSVWAAASTAAAPVAIEYFYQPGCHDCEDVAAFILPQLEEQFPGQYRLHRYDMGIKENVLRLLRRQRQLHVADNPTVVIIVNGSVYLGGYDRIAAQLLPAVRAATAAPPTTHADAATADHAPVATAPSAPRELEQEVSFTPAMVIMAGLADGINPCVFSTLVFFLTLLLTLRVSRTKLLLSGGVYCLAGFLTYLALGFGMFRFLKLLTGYSLLRTGLNLVLLGLLLGLAMVSFRDAWRYYRTRQAAAVMLQLPDRIKTGIHRLMRRGLRYRLLLPGIFGIGVAVTLLESVCTGQVYIPTLILLTREAGPTSRWFFYLLLYNLMFILPLIILFLALGFGASMTRLLRWSRRNVIIGKIFLGVLFLGLAAILLHSW